MSTDGSVRNVYDPLPAGHSFSGHDSSHTLRGYSLYAIIMQAHGLTLTSHFRNYPMQSQGHLEWILKRHSGAQYSHFCTNDAIMTSLVRKGLNTIFYTMTLIQFYCSIAIQVEVCRQYIVIRHYKLRGQVISSSVLNEPPIL